MRYRLVLALWGLLPLSPAYGAPHVFSATNHATAALLLSESDQSVKLAGKSLFRVGSDDNELQDLFGEIVWNNCSGARKLSPDTFSWLVKAIGKTKQSRFGGLMDYCLSKNTDKKVVYYLQTAKGELTGGGVGQFEAGHVDLAKVRAGLQAHRAKGSQSELIKRFESLHKGQALSDVYAFLGYPDAVGMASIAAGEVGHMYVHVRSSTAAIELSYKDAGTVQFVYQDGAPDWKVDNATSARGLYWSDLDGRFTVLKEQIAKGNGGEMREVAESLLMGGSLAEDVAETAIARIKSTIPDQNNAEMMDGLLWLAKAVMEKGGANDERTMVMYLIAQGNGRQLRGVAGHLIDKGVTAGEVPDAAMARISASRATQDDELADGLAWLCKAVLNSGDAKYKPALADVSASAAHKSLRKYAEKAANGLER